MSKVTIKEIYYYNPNIYLQSTTEIHNVKINNQNKNIHVITSNNQVKLIKQDGTYGGIFYVNRNIDDNTSNATNKTINSTNIVTMSTDIGILTFMVHFNNNILHSGDSYITKPIFCSGGYLGKDVTINIQVLNNKEQTRKYTIFY